MNESQVASSENENFNIMTMLDGTTHEDIKIVLLPRVEGYKIGHI